MNHPERIESVREGGVPMQVSRDRFHLHLVVHEEDLGEGSAKEGPVDGCVDGGAGLVDVLTPGTVELN